MPLPHPLSLLVLCALLGTAPAWAQQQDTVVFKASYALLTDSNLFRLPASANTQALLGTDSAAERIGVTSVGLSFNKAYSLQRVELDLTLVDYAYQNFDYLSFTARNYNAAWRWSLTPRLYGSLSADRKETLNSFSDYQGNTPASATGVPTPTAVLTPPMSLTAPGACWVASPAPAKPTTWHWAPVMTTATPPPAWACATHRHQTVHSPTASRRPTANT